jgi:RNA-directed DNA polymerase
MGCQYEADARRVWAALRERLAQFGLTLHEGKTRLIEFGRFPAERRRRCGERRPETFAFLGFTHYCGWTRDGRFVVKRRTEGRRLTRKLHEVRAELWRRMHAPVATQQARLVTVLRGHYAYYGLPSNWRRLDSFYDAVRRCWYRVLRRRSQRSLTWAGFPALEARFPLPQPRITHPLLPLAPRLGTP